jgi:hypothetical protein
MRHSSSLVRPLALVLLVVSVAGCSWFKKGAKGDYALAPEARPLEVPPDLNLPNTSGAMQVPNVGPAASSAGAATNAAGGFTVGGSRDEAFTRVGEALAGIEGVAIASRAQLLGTYDVSYEGASFLVRECGRCRCLCVRSRSARPAGHRRGADQAAGGAEGEAGRLIRPLHWNEKGRLRRPFSLPSWMRISVRAAAACPACLPILSRRATDPCVW